MRILIFKGSAQYNAFNRFAEHLGNGFEQLGHEVDFADAHKNGDGHAAVLKAMKRKPHLAVGFNAIGADLKVDGKSIYEESECSYLGLLLDHPAFHTGRIAKAPRKAIYGVVDGSHIDYLRKTAPLHPLFFAPHGGIQHEDWENEDRPIDLLFLGTGMDANRERNAWKEFPPQYCAILEEAYEEFLKKPQAWDSLITAASKRHEIHLPTHLMASLIVQLEIVMRADYRFRILKKFDDAGVKVTVMGNGWEYAKFKHHELHPSVEFYDATKLTCKAKASLNASPQFFTGTHERVFVSMLNGALPVTSASSYYEKHFKDGEHYLSFDMQTLPATIETLKGMLKTPSKLNKARGHAMEIALKEHTWKSRAKEFLEKFQSIAVTQYLYQKQWF